MNDVAELLNESRFRLTDTGGGIVQWLFDHAPTGRYVVATDEQDGQPSDASAPVFVRRHDESGELTESRRYETLREFLDSFPVPT